jgi:hypothetical protein
MFVVEELNQYYVTVKLKSSQINQHIILLGREGVIGTDKAPNSKFQRRSQQLHSYL